MDTSKHKQKILLLVDLDQPVENVLKSTVNLAQMVHADVELFSVKQLTDIIKRESQLSAMRTMNETQTKTENQLLSLIAPISKTNDVKINYNFVFGNTKTEISKHIDAQQPDIVVLGKRKKTLNPLGNNVTDFVLKHFNGTVVIANNHKIIGSVEDLNLGVFNADDGFENQNIIKDLMPHAVKPLKSFQVVKNKTPNLNKDNIITHVFDQGNNAMESLCNFLTKSNVNLLWVDRNPKQNDKKSISGIKDLISNLDVNIVLSRH